jgi:hypothetical protein
MGTDDTGRLTTLYRAVGLEEYYSIIRTEQFSCHPTGAEVKYFGLDYKETERFANMVINLEVVAVFAVTVLCSVLDQVGDFTEVDPFLFKKGTVEIHYTDLKCFNNAIDTIVQVL